MLLGFFIITLVGVSAIYLSGINFSKTLITKIPEKLTTTEKEPIHLNGPLATPIPQTFKEKIVSSTPSSQTPPTIIAKAAESNTIDISNLYSLINAHRKEQNLSTLRIHQALELSSRRKLEEMRATKYWQHENRDGVISWEVFKQSGYNYSNAGENLSFGNNSAWAVFNGWVNSPQHNQQMLSTDYEDMGLAIDCENYEQAGQKSCAVVLHLGKQLL